MSDESDETRRFSPDDAEGPSSEAEKPRKPDPDDLDATQVGGRPADPDAAQVGSSPADPEATQVDSDAVGDETTVGRASVPPPGDEDTLDGVRRADDTLDDVRTVPAIRDEPTVVTEKPGATAVMPPVDDWAPSRANPAWSGRAEVRPPQPGRGYPEVDWAASTPAQPRDRWWMPIVVGIVALILLGVLGWAIYLILQDSSGDEAPAPVPSTSAAPAETATATATTGTTSPSASPTTTSPEPEQSTTDPTASEITIPALRGLALAEAQEALRSSGLNYRLIYRQAPDVPPDTVIDSDPVEGQEVPPDTTVTLVIAAQSTGTPTTTTEPTDGAGAGGN
ncbi:PASTA domain-containing protein [Paractinoplanes lichenicola]|uniref:PASTA domain-containing protein n=1 Tax=Paractinoplanes lichenicola TaxID=2802976 RepID=A0ABS1W232_9ACTN|nr:PASTA domain-containing protein [Actinoplanes lichenicola]MBL7260782.1 PASTA domain-containing protein [Actinoplanes lichenicola]